MVLLVVYATVVCDLPVYKEVDLQSESCKKSSYCMSFLLLACLHALDMLLFCFCFSFFNILCYVHALCVVQLHGFQSQYPTLSCCMNFVVKFFIGIVNLSTNDCYSALVKHIAMPYLITMNCFDRQRRLQGFQKTQPPSIFNHLYNQLQLCFPEQGYFIVVPCISL